MFLFIVIILFITSNFCFSYCDASTNWQLGLQEPATPSAEGIIFFNNYLCFFLLAICILVFWFLRTIIVLFSNNNKVQLFTHSSSLEIIWTIFPAVILLFLAIPSFALLYSLDELIDPELTLKVIGHQWYWSYEYSDFSLLNSTDSLSFDSYMISTNDLVKGSFRLLEVDNRVILPINTHIRLLVTSADVLHSWAVPSFGLKVDACPGRLSQASIFIKRSGLFFGQCSEICGINHGFMPIAVKSVGVDDFLSWSSSKINEI
jgi:cytochrome c oxidase subunit 2